MLVTGLAENDDQKLKAAEWVLRLASPALIVEMLKKMQGLKGRFYTEVAERLYGQDLDMDQLTHVERSICEMMERKHVTVSELAEWYRVTIETVYDRTKFQPLPDYAACVGAVEMAQAGSRRLREAAEAVQDGGEAALPKMIASEAEDTKARSISELFAELRRRLS